MDALLHLSTSCYNCRAITGGSVPSIHGYGLAIDINTIQNPYVKRTETEEIIILPKKGAEYLDRKNIRPGMAESVVDILTKNGFRDWGGSWNDPDPIDWQHFQTPTFIARLMATMSPDDAKEFFTLYSDNIAYKLFDSFSDDDGTVILLYKGNPKRFMEILRTNYAKINNYTPTATTAFLTKELESSKSASGKIDL